jgi:D-galactarolactone cycloisomerase
VSASSVIRRADVVVLEHPVGQAIGPAAVSYHRRSCVLVRLVDGDGRTGWGETYLGPGVAAAAAELAGSLIGRQPSAGRPLLDLLFEAGLESGTALSAVAIALDDLRGRQLGLSVAALHGGARRTSVRAYASSGGYRDGVDPEVSWLDDVRSATDDGFSVVKLRIGRFDPRRELPLLERVRAQTPADFDLVVDANGAYSLPRAREVGRGLAAAGYRWLEEPLIRFRAGMAYPGYEGLRDLGIAIAAGEGLGNRSAFAAFLDRGAVDIVQPDVAICGGVGEGLFIAELAALTGRPCVPHAWGGAVLLAATLQLLAVLPEPSEVLGVDSPLLEFDRFENRMRTELTDHDFALVGGRVAIPDGPGLGIEVDEEQVRALAVTTPSW